MPHTEKDLGPATPSLSHESQAPAVKVVRDVFQGTRHMRQQGKEYLPDFPKEPPDAYSERLDRAVLFNALKRTVEAQVGMVMRKDPEISEEAPDPVAEHMENVDLTGRDLTTFVDDHLTDAMLDGHAHIFIDMQEPPEASSALEEREAGNRPYWIPIRKQDVLRFRSRSIGGVKVVTEYAYHEVTVERVGEWKEQEVHRVREYKRIEVDGQTRVGYKIYRLDPEKKWPGEWPDDWSVVNESAPEPDVMAIDRIPVATTYTGRTGFMTSSPPFEDLAYLNIRHYQTDSDNETLARTAKVPILVFLGVSEDDVQTVAIGPGNAIVLQNEDASVEWEQADGSDYNDFANDLQRVEKRMAMLGLSMLMSESRAAETAESKRIDKSESDSRLASAARNLQNALNEALAIHGRWLDIEEPGSISVNMDFESQPLDSAVFRELRELWAERGISWETLVSAAKQGEVLPDDLDVDEERARIADEDGMRMDAAMGEVFGEGGSEE